jgi:hypothetical protein
MIGRLSGTLLEKTPPQVVVDVHGLGYEIDVPMSTFYHLPTVGETVSLLTHFVVREDGQYLYGFGSVAVQRRRNSLGHFMVQWGMFGISSVDNFVKPILISRASSRPLLLIVVGVFGGVLVFGFINSLL